MFEFMTEKLLSLVQIIQTLSKEKRELRDNALRAISTALVATRAYINDIERGKKRCFDTEKQLALYWSAAAIPIRHIDPEFALTCETKSEYWLNPESWPTERVHDYGISLDRVHREYKKMMVPGISPKDKRIRVEPKIT